MHASAKFKGRAQNKDHLRFLVTVGISEVENKKICNCVRFDENTLPATLHRQFFKRPETEPQKMRLANVCFGVDRFVRNTLLAKDVWRSHGWTLRRNNITPDYDRLAINAHPLYRPLCGQSSTLATDYPAVASIHITR